MAKREVVHDQASSPSVLPPCTRLQVAIQCSIALQLLDVPNNVAILSRSPPDEANGNMTLATYRCQDATSRISVKCKVGPYPGMMRVEVHILDTICIEPCHQLAAYLPSAQ